MKNVHVLPTEKRSRLVLETVNDSLFLTTTTDFGTNIMKFQNIYITSDEEIKEGWYFNNAIGVNKSVFVEDKDIKGLKNLYGNKPRHLEKIILTTDQELIADGVQAINDDFLQWFVKNPSCESVEVESFCKYGDYCPSQGAYDKKHLCDIGYKIIIPKEEQKQHLIDIMKGDEDLGLYEHGQEVRHSVQVETLEEAAKELYPTKNTSMFMPNRHELNNSYKQEAFIEGAVWQQARMYSEEDMYKFANFCRIYDEYCLKKNTIDVKNTLELFEQFKK